MNDDTEIQVKVARLEEKQVAAKDALDKAYEAELQHFEQVNGLLNRLREQHTEFIGATKDFVTRHEHEDVLRQMREERDFRQNVGGREQMVKVVWVVLSFAIGLLFMYLMKR